MIVVGILILLVLLAMLPADGVESVLGAVLGLAFLAVKVAFVLGVAFVGLIMVGAVI